MLHACAARFDVTGNLENFWQLNKALDLDQCVNANSLPCMPPPD